MNKIIIAGVALLTIILTVLIIAGESYASTINDIRVLKISSEDQRAVVKDSDGKTRVIKPGVPTGKSGKVVEIAAGRIVIEEKKDDAIEKIIIRLVDGKRIFERLSRKKEQSPLLFAPATQNKGTTRIH